MNKLLLLLLALLIGFALIAAATDFEVSFALVFGWIPFLVRVLPRVAVDRPSVAVGIAALILFTLGVHLAGRRWLRWRFGRSVGMTAGVGLLFAAGIAVVGMTHQVGWLATSPEPWRVEGLARRQWYGSRSNLKVIGLGLQNYDDAYPDALPADGNFAPDGAMMHSWETRILPFLGYSAREIDLKKPWNDPANVPAFQSILLEFINPEQEAGNLTDADGYGLSHYAANVRVLGGNTKMRLADIADGTATTILAGEVNANFRPWGHPVNWRDPARGVNRTPYGFGGPRGSGGAHFLMADGSVRWVSDRVGREVVEALATPAAGDAVDPTVLQDK